jgi:glycerol uptake facilitator-like aquaporin
MNALLKKSLAEFVGVTVFLTSIIGATGILRTIAFALTIGLMILLLRPISGAHLNPATSLYFLSKRQITTGTFLAYVGAQLAGALAGVALGEAISGGNIGGFSGPASNLPSAYFIGEVLATAGMIFLIGTLLNNKQDAWLPFAVTAWVIAAATFTKTGAQANPAVTFGLMFNGMPANQGVALMVAEVTGVLVAVILLMIFSSAKKKPGNRKK